MCVRSFRLSRTKSGSQVLVFQWLGNGVVDERAPDFFLRPLLKVRRDVSHLRVALCFTTPLWATGQSEPEQERRLT